MDLPILPILTVCHRRHHRVQGGTFFYNYGLLAFPGAGVVQQRAPFCMAVRRCWEPDQDLADGSLLGPDLLAVSKVFRVSAQSAMIIFERLAFADEPVSPHHVADLVDDLLIHADSRETASLAAAAAS